MNPRTRQKVPTALWLLPILALGTGLRILAFGGLVGTDDAMYADLAHKVASGQFASVHAMELGAFPLRVGVYGPAAVAFRILGVSEASLAVYPFLVSMLSILLAFVAGRLFFGRQVGLIAALLCACLPIDARYATLLFPDLVAAFWVNVGILFLYRGSREGSGARKLSHGLLCGLALGVSWLCKESMVFSLPFIASISSGPLMSRAAMHD